MKVWRTAAVVFVVVIIGATAVGGIVGSMTAEEPEAPQTAPEHIELNNPQYDADRVSEDPSPGTADVQMDSSAENKTIVIHTGGSVTERDIQPLVNALVANEHNIIVESSAPAMPPIPGPIFGMNQEQIVPPGPGPGQGQGGVNLGDALEDAHGYIGIGVSSYSDTNLNALSEFMQNDGRVVMAVNPGQAFSFQGGNSETFSELGMYTEPGYAYNLGENDLNFQRIYAEPSGDEMLTEGVDRVMLATATTIGGGEQDETLMPLDGTQRSTTRAETDQPLMIRTGEVALIGDTRFMTPENAQRVDNDVFIGNIADFLVSGSRVTEEDVNDGGSNGDGKTVTVTVGPNGEPRFQPQVVEIDPGDTVKFIWDSGGHNLVPVQKPDQSEWQGVPEVQEEGYTHEHTFEYEGVYEIVSEPSANQSMVMGVIVGDPDPPALQQRSTLVGAGY